MQPLLLCMPVSNRSSPVPGSKSRNKTAQASHGDTKTRRKVLGRNADVLVGNSTPEQDKYGNSETRLKNASIRGIAFSDVFDKHTNCGSKRTGEFAEKHRNPWIHLAQRSSSYERPALILQQFITDNGVEILNVAGTRGSKEPDVWKFAYETLEAAFFSQPAPAGMCSGFQFPVSDFFFLLP